MKTVTGGIAAICALMLSCYWVPASAARVAVSPGAGSLQQAINAAGAGDTLVLAAGRYQGPIIIDRAISLTAESPAASVIVGDGEQHVIVVAAADVSIQNLKITGSGEDLSTEDSGIFVTEAGDRALIRNNHIEGNLIGIYLKGPSNARVIGNRIIGRDDLHLSEAGNGIHLWNTPGSVVEDNDVSGGRDGIFVTTSRDNIFRNNRFRDLRFAIHYMYTNHSRVENNRSTGNHMGYAIMFSSHLEISNNVSIDDRDKGLFLNFTNDSEIVGNDVNGGPEKCLFIYNSHFNSIERNRFRGCDIGVHFTAGSEDNSIFNNSFDGNRMQVKYVGTRLLEWSKDGVGNYWSDHVAFDRNRDGIADNHYQPNNLVDQIIWRNPSAKVLLNSPALQLLHWAQSQFPALHPGGVVDSAPLMQSQWASQQ